jgi:hypothetical protein
MDQTGSSGSPPEGLGEPCEDSPPEKVGSMPKALSAQAIIA